MVGSGGSKGGNVATNDANADRLTKLLRRIGGGGVENGTNAQRTGLTVAAAAGVS